MTLLAITAGRRATMPPMRLEIVGFRDLLSQALLGQKTLGPTIATSAGTSVSAASIITPTQITSPGAIDEKMPNLAKNSAVNEVSTTSAADKIASPAWLSAKDTAPRVWSPVRNRSR